MEQLLQYATTCPRSWGPAEFVCGEDLLAQFRTMLTARSEMKFLEGIRDAPKLLHLIHALIASLPADAILTSLLRPFFEQAVLIGDPVLRLHGLHSLVWALPESHLQLLLPLLAFFRSLASAQLSVVAKLFGSVLGNAAVVEGLSKEYDAICTHGLGPSIKLGKPEVGCVSVLRGSPKALFEKLLDVSYDLLESDYVEMFLTVYPYFYTDEALLEELRDRYTSLLVVGAQSWEFEVRKRILVIAHQLLASRKSVFSEEFKETLSSFKLAVHEPENPAITPHVLYLMRFNPNSMLVGSAWHVFDEDVSNVKPRNALDHSVQDWAACLTRVASSTFVKVAPGELLRRHWENETNSPNVSKLSKLFNGLQHFVATQILVQDDRAQALVIMEHFIRLSHALAQMRNYHCSFAVFAGLSMVRNFP